MRGHIQVASLRGIPIRVHFTFLLILPFLAWSFAQAFRGAAAAASVPPERLMGSPWLWGLGVAVALARDDFRKELEGGERRVGLGHADAVPLG